MIGKNLTFKTSEIKGFSTAENGTPSSHLRSLLDFSGILVRLAPFAFFSGPSILQFALGSHVTCPFATRSEGKCCTPQRALLRRLRNFFALPMDSTLSAAQ